jgi:hypothetical protein
MMNHPMAKLDVQLSLIAPPAFTPIPSGSLHYVPALLDWKGERDALRTASEATWQGMTPLVQVAPTGDPAKEISVAAIGNRLREVARAVRSHPIYLDTLGVSATKPTLPRGHATVLQHVHEAARRQGISSVPVYSMGDEAHADVVAAAAAQDGRGVAIRYRVGDAHYVGGGTLADRLVSALDHLGVDAVDADVILDFGWLRPEDEIGLEEVSLLVDRIYTAGKWRNVIVLATSIPSSFEKIREGTIGSIPRREWILWNALHEIGSARTVFGDYGVQHPRAPRNRRGGQMRANIRYTTREGTLVARGEGAIMRLDPSERAQQYRKLCYDLVTNNLFVGRGCCSGDDTIQDCADGLLVAEAQPMWRGVGTAHSLKEVTSSLAALRTALIKPESLTPAARARRGAVPVAPPERR